MHFELRQGLRFCIVGGSAVFLDIASGRYFALGHANFAAFEHWLAEAQLSEDDLATLLRLRDAGILLVATEARPRSTAPELQTPKTALDTCGARPRWAQIAAAFARRVVWSRRVKRWPFERMIGQVSRRAAEPGKESAEVVAARLHATVRAFEIVDAVLGSHDRCLARSLALTAACRSLGVPAQLVIAVQTAPFAAHSWVQQGTRVLNEKPDRADLFTPILVA